MSGVDPNSLTDEQLEAELSASVGVEPPPGEPPPPPQAPPEVPKETEPPPEVQEAQPEPPKEPELDVEAEQRRLLLEELEARAKHWESVAGRNAGKLGYMESQLKAIQAAQAQMAQQQVDEQGEPIERPQPPPPARDGLAEWAVAQAVNQAVAAFESSHPDTKELQEKMVEHIKASGYDMNSVLGMSNPIEAQREVARSLEEAYWHTKATVSATRRSELLAKREVIQSQAAANKLKASVSATASSPPPKPQPKTVNDMTDAELEAEMVRVQGGRW